MDYQSRLVMHKIAYYVTDYGFGHATRAIALIRHLEHKYDILIRNDSLHDIFTGSLVKCQMLEGQTDSGLILSDGRLVINEHRTNQHFAEWMGRFEKTVEKEADFLKRNDVDLVVSDISCMPFLAAKKAGIRSVGISNFTWADILDNFTNRDANIVNELEEAYSYADVAIELTGSCDMKSFREKKKGGLLCRQISESRSSVRKMLGIDENELAVLLTFGGSVRFYIDPIVQSGYKIVIPAKFEYSSEAVRIPASYYETQNIVGAMDAVISKSGYGIVSECAQAGVPLLMACKNNSMEDTCLSKLIEECALGSECTLESILDGGILDRVPEAIELTQSRGTRIENGNINCAAIIDSLLR